MIFQFFFFNKSAKMSTILCFSVNMGCCVYINEKKKMNLNDFSKWLQYNRVKNLRRSEYFPYPLCIYISGGPLSALTCCVNVRLLSAIKKNIAVNLFSKLGWELGLYYASYDDFHPDILARMYT